MHGLFESLGYVGKLPYRQQMQKRRDPRSKKHTVVKDGSLIRRAKFGGYECECEYKCVCVSVFK